MWFIQSAYVCVVETKSQWKRSTMETQIQVPTTSSRERQAPGQALNHMAVECIIERPMDDNSSPICLSINNSMGERQHVRIKYISCDEDNNPIEEASEGNSNQSHSYSHSHSHSHGHNHTHRCTHSQNKTGIQQLWCKSIETVSSFKREPIKRRVISL